MSEIRQDPVSGHVVIIAPERALRPHAFPQLNDRQRPAEPCPFCPGNEAETPPELFALRDSGGPNQRGWRVRIVPNKYPALGGPDGLIGPAGSSRREAVGAHEVIVESPLHDLSFSRMAPAGVAELFGIIQERISARARDPRVEYVFYFKNQGEAAGATLEHPHAQLIALPLAPPAVRSELAGAQRYWQSRGICFFCELAAGESVAGERRIVENDAAIALAPWAARAPYETWILPRAHEAHFEKARRCNLEAVAELVRATLRKLDRLAGGDCPYNLVLHSAPPRNGPLDFYHWHFELIPRLTKLAGFEWGTSMFINPVAPEEAARRLRQTGDG